jgi:hypothetical protein
VRGFIGADQAQPTPAARDIGRIDRRRCRKVFEQRFAARVMARRYLDVYRELADATLAGAPLAA